MLKTSEDIPVYDSSQLRPPAIEQLIETLRYKYLIQQLIRRNILSRYKRSFLGVAWTMLTPLGLMLVKVIVFSTIFGRDPGYPVYVLSGLITFQFFTETTNTTMRNLIWGGNLLRRIYIPAPAFAIAPIGTSLVNLLFTLIPLFLVMLGTGVDITLYIVFLPLAILLLAAFSLGFSMIVSVLAIYFPDVAEMIRVITQAWLYLTPIIYPEKILPNQVLTLMKIFNPMYYFVNMFRIPVYEARFPTWAGTWPGILWAVSVLVVGWVVFCYKADEFAYRA